MNKYEKVMGAGDVLVVAFGAMIGWGWVVSSGTWISDAGVLGTILGFVIGGLMIYFVGLTYAELAAAIPKNGGAQEFSRIAFGKNCSFVCTWVLILSYLGVVCFEACSFPTILQYIFPGIMKGYLYTIAGFDIYASWLIIAAAATILITLINVVGIKTAAKVQTFFTLIIALVGVILTVAAFINGSSSNLEGQFMVGTRTQGLKNTLAIAVVAPFYLFGFDVIPQASEEINVPRKRLGRLMMLSIVMAIIFYSAVVLSVGYALNTDEMAESIASTGLVTADAMSKLFNSAFMAKVLIFGGLCGIITSWNSFLIGGSRSLASLAEAGFIPGVFGKLHSKYKTPYVSIILLGCLALVSLLFGRVMLTWISNTASFACCIAYGIVAASFMKLRKTELQLDRPYRVKHYMLVGVLAVAMAGLMVLLYLVPGSGSSFGYQEWTIFAIWSAVGLILFLGNRKKLEKAEK